MGLLGDRRHKACSHTHCGPVTGTNLLTMYKLDAEQHRRIVDYAQFLETTIVAVVDRAVAHVEDVKLSWGCGRCDFAVNRRSPRRSPRAPRAAGLAGAGRP